jgi:hypothetical protein
MSLMDRRVARQLDNRMRPSREAFDPSSHIRPDSSRLVSPAGNSRAPRQIAECVRHAPGGREEGILQPVSALGATQLFLAPFSGSGLPAPGLLWRARPLRETAR